MNSTRSPEKVHPGIALALLTSLRDQDTPDEAIEDEEYAHSLPRRLGLNDVINVQMRRYADLKDAGRSLPLSEFLDLVRLISRRPDAVEIFRSAGAALAVARFAESGAIKKVFRRLSTEKARRRKLERSMARAARALTPGAAIVTERDPPGMQIRDCALAPVGIEGNACEILTAVLEVCVTELWDPDRSVEHAECLGHGDATCAWRVTDAGEAGQPAAEASQSGTRAAG